MSVERYGSSYRLNVGMATLVNVFGKPSLKAGYYAERQGHCRVVQPAGGHARPKLSRFQFTGKVGE